MTVVPGVSLPLVRSVQPSPTCTGLVVTSLEGDLGLPAAVPHPPLAALHPPPPGPGPRPAGGAAPAPPAPGGPLTAVPGEGRAEVPVSPGGVPGVAPVERLPIPPLTVVQAGLKVASLPELRGAVVTI